MVSSIYTPNKRIDYYRNLSRALMPKQIRAYNPNIRNPYAQTASTNLANVLSGLVQTYSAEEQLGKAEQLEAEQLAAQRAIGGRLAQMRTPGTGPTLDIIETAMPISDMDMVQRRQQQVRRRPFSVDAPQFTPEQMAAAGTTPELLQGRIAEIRTGRKEAYTARQKEELERGLTRALTAGDDDLVSQYEKILYPKEILRRRAEQRKTGEAREYEEGVRDKEKVYQEGLTATQRTQHLADKKQDRAWKLEDNSTARKEAAARRKQSIDDQLQIALQKENWREAGALKRRKEKIEDELATEGRKLLHVYDFTLKKNVTITRSKYDKDTSRYGPKGSDKELKKSWVTVTNKAGEQKHQYLTDREIGGLVEEKVDVTKYVSPSRKYQYLGVYVLDGEVIGEGVHNRHTGEKYIQKTVDGKIVKETIPPRAEPRTESSLSAGQPNFVQFKKISDANISDENQIRNYARYMKNQQSRSLGWRLLADDLTAYYKTFLDDGSKQMGLTKKELAFRVAQGQLQGLLGGARIITVGPGVMTEQDARRVLQNLGGNLTALQNPQVVAVQLSRMFNDKARQYKNNLDFYNTAVKYRYKRQNYKLRENLLDSIDPDLFQEDVFLGSPVEEVGYQENLLPPAERIPRMTRAQLLALPNADLNMAQMRAKIAALKLLVN
tara:strand:+ start:229 stop:2220 length:1992 start_codon:yes stop_codon:yes gene_type:complete